MANPVTDDGTDPVYYYKATITVYSMFDPMNVELSALAREAETGAAICTTYTAETIEPDALPEEAASFFALGDN
jgi:hypothetical protein